MSMKTRLSAARPRAVLVAATVLAAAVQLPVWAGTASITLNSPAQTIDGFGGSTAWAGAISDSVANTLFSNGTQQQIGLSICRIRIDPTKAWSEETSNSQKAHARGAKVLGTPWTPPASMKSNNNVVGGSLNTSQYAAYASYLASAASSIGLDYVSMQNEPDANVTYESCFWTAAQMQTWCANNAPAVAHSIVMAESESFNTGFTDPTLNNATSASHVAVIAGHIYGAAPFNYTNAINHGKHVWMTEHYLNGTDIGTCVKIAKEINDCMANNMSAYVWWTVTWNTSAVIDTSGNLLKNGYTLAQYSKYIRPGYTRVNATYSPSTNIYETAYTGAGHTVVVAINTGSTSVSQSFAFTGGTLSGSMTPYQTSGSLNLSQMGNISISNNAFTATLPAQSITTFVH